MATAFPPFDGSAPKTQEFNEAPEMGIDPSKRYTATMSTSLGDDRHRARCHQGAEDRQQLRVPRAAPLLRRRDLPPDHQRLHVPGRRPDRHRSRRPRLPLRGRARRSRASTRSARSPWPTPARTPTAASSSSVSGPSGVGLPPAYSLLRSGREGSRHRRRRCSSVATGGGDKPEDDVVINSVTITVSDD